MDGRIDLERDDYSVRMYAKSDFMEGIADVSMTIAKALEEGHITQEELDELQQDSALN